MKGVIARTDYAPPVDPVTDGQIDALERELDRRRTLKAQQDAEIARKAAEAEEAACIEQARKDAEEVEAEAERVRRLAVMDAVARAPVPSGLLLAETGVTGISSDVISVLDTQLRFGAVVKAEGDILLPVVTCCGVVSVADGLTLKAHKLTSQPLRREDERVYLAAYRVAVRKVWEAAVEVEIERAGEGAAVMLYTAALPSVVVVPDELNPPLVRIVGAWGDCFAYRLPNPIGPDLEAA